MNVDAERETSHVSTNYLNLDQWPPGLSGRTALPQPSMFQLQASSLLLIRCKYDKREYITVLLLSSCQ